MAKPDELLKSQFKMSLVPAARRAPSTFRRVLRYIQQHPNAIPEAARLASQYYSAYRRLRQPPGVFRRSFGTSRRAFKPQLKNRGRAKKIIMKKRPAALKLKRKPFKRRGRKRRFNRKKRAIALLSAVQPINTFVYQTAEQHILTVANATSTSAGAQCVYFNATQHNRSGAADASYPGALNINDLCVIASKFSATAGNLAIKYTLYSYRMLHNIVNQGNAYCYLDCFYCIARRDLTASQATPLTDLGTGFTLAGQNAGTVVTNSIELTPFQSTAFCINYRIYKKKTLKLDPGQQVTLSVSSRAKRRINMARLLAPTDQLSTVLNSPASITQLKGNKFILFRLRGALANDQTTQTTLGMTGAKINMFTRFMWKFQWLNDYTETIFADAQTGFGSVTNADIMDEATGTVTTYQTA